MKGFLQHHFSESVMTWTHVYKGVVETWSEIQTDTGSQYQVPMRWALPMYSTHSQYPVPVLVRYMVTIPESSRDLWLKI